MMDANTAVETVALRLPRNAVGQILDGLDVLAEQWEATAAYLVDGQASEGDVLIRECSDEREAQKIAAHYRRISGLIEEQLERGGQDAE
jgi:hypothetical protein